MKEEGREEGRDLDKEKAEALVSNPAFKRFTGSFELYQKLYSSESNHDEMARRMHDFYLARFSQPINEAIPNVEKAKSLLEGALNDCEAGDFTALGFAKNLVNLRLADEMLAMWNPDQEFGGEGADKYRLNAVVHYNDEGNGVISLHLGASGVSSEEFLAKTIEGFALFAKKLQSGEIPAKTIIMKSWLLGKRSEAKVKALLGEDIEIRNTDPEDKEVEAIQQTALEHNNKSFERYLKTGEKPEVRQVEITADRFVKKLLG
ncbi:MAG: hypothetical protein WC813_04080 [Patescibacteria group bacterium]